MTVADAAALVNALEDAASQGTGCLFVADENAARSGRVFFRDGKVYAVHVDGFKPKVGQRLRTGGMLTADQYDALLWHTGGNVYEPNLGSAAVTQGLIAQDVLDAVLREILLSSIGAMFAWPRPTAKFKKNADTDQFTIPPVSVKSIVKAVEKRRARWDELWNQIAPGVAPEHTYPQVVTEFPAHEEKSSEVEAVLAAATGSRSLDEVAGECGLTRFETGHVLGHLAANEIVTMHDAPTEPGYQPQAETGSHGTAEVALSEPGLDEEPPVVVAFDKAAPVPGEVDQYDRTELTDAGYPQVTHPDTEVVSVTSTDYDTHQTPHFAPDVVDTVEHVEVPEDIEEPSAFGLADDTLPDGMDLGQIPTEQIQNDNDPAPVSEVPPVTGLLDAVENHHPMVPVPVGDAHDLPVPPVPTPYAEVGFTSEPAPLPTDLPHFADPVPPVPAPVAQTPEPPMVPSPPPGVPVFVDASALDAQRAAEIADGMPGVPLPPLPDFFPAPVEPVAPVPPVQDEQPEQAEEYVEPEPVVSVQEAVVYEEIRQDVVEADEHAAEPAPVEEPNGSHDTFDDDRTEYEEAPEVEGADAASDDADPQADLDDAFEETPEVDSDEVAAVPVEDARTAAARQRLLDEINTDAAAATAAENALARAEADHEANVAAAAQMNETLNRYEEFLLNAEEDKARLQEDASAVERDRLDAEAEKDATEEQAKALADEVADASAQVEAAREALRKAEASLAEAEEHLDTARNTQTLAHESVQHAQDKVADLDRRAETIAADLREAEERVESYTTEIDDVRQMAESLEAAKETGEKFKAAAEARLESTRRRLAAKQDRLAQLG